MKLHKSITIDRIVAALENDSNNPGFCTFCGADAFGVEPDARNYECEECNMNCVFGAEELLIMVGI